MARYSDSQVADLIRRNFIQNTYCKYVLLEQSIKQVHNDHDAVNDDEEASEACDAYALGNI